MIPAKKAGFRILEERDNAWHSLLANNQFEQITNCLEEAHRQAVAAGDEQRAALLAAARQLCASCADLQNEVVFHEQVTHHLETRRDKLGAELSKLLGMMQIESETAVPPLHPTKSLWQHVKRFFRRRMPLLFSKPEPQNPHPHEGEKTGLTLPETAVSLSMPSLIMPTNPVQSKTPATVPQLTVYCLGNFRVYEDNHYVSEWTSRKGKSIFKYLLLHRQRHVTKEVLMAQFWPDAMSDAARNNLNVAIYGLRQALRNDYQDFSHVLYQDDCYFLNPDMDIWLDCEAFETAFHHACQFEEQGEFVRSLEEFHAAEELYQGELLADDPYEEWPAAYRQQLEIKYIQLLTHLSVHYFVVEQYATCILFAKKLLQVEPCHEAAHRLLMRAYARQRQSYLALRQYHQCVEQLDDELATQPEPETTRLYKAIRDQQPI